MNIGLSEMLLIAAIALIFLGPEKFPDFAKIVVRTVRDIRGYVDDAKNELSKELRPVEREMKKLSRFDEDNYTNKWKTDVKKTPKKEEKTEAAVPPAPEETKDAQNIVDPGVEEEGAPPFTVPQGSFEETVRDIENAGASEQETEALPPDEAWRRDPSESTRGND